MCTTGKLIAWVCIFSVLFTGCYTSTLIDTHGNDIPKLDAGDVDYVVSRDGTTYMFAKTPTVVDSTMVGELKATAAPGFADDPTAWKNAPKGTTVSLRVSDLTQVHLSKPRPGASAGAVVGVTLLIVLVIGGIAFISEGGVLGHRHLNLAD